MLVTPIEIRTAESVQRDSTDTLQTTLSGKMSRNAFWRRLQLSRENLLVVPDLHRPVRTTSINGHHHCDSPVPGALVIRPEDKSRFRFEFG